MADEREVNLTTIKANGAYIASWNGDDQTNRFMKGLILTIDVTAVTATPSVVFTVQGKDELSGKYYTLLASAAITATGTTKLYIYPNATAAANTVANHALPRVWRVIAVAADADSATYTVGAVLVP